MFCSIMSSAKMRYTFERCSAAVVYIIFYYRWVSWPNTILCSKTDSPPLNYRQVVYPNRPACFATLSNAKNSSSDSQSPSLIWIATPLLPKCKNNIEGSQRSRARIDIVDRRTKALLNSHLVRNSIITSLETRLRSIHRIVDSLLGSKGLTTVHPKRSEMILSPSTTSNAPYNNK